MTHADLIGSWSPINAHWTSRNEAVQGRRAGVKSPNPEEMDGINEPRIPLFFAEGKDTFFGKNRSFDT